VRGGRPVLASANPSTTVGPSTSWRACRRLLRSSRAEARAALLLPVASDGCVVDESDACAPDPWSCSGCAGDGGCDSVAFLLDGFFFLLSRAPVGTALSTVLDPPWMLPFDDSVALDGLDLPCCGGGNAGGWLRGGLVVSTAVLVDLADVELFGALDFLLCPEAVGCSSAVVGATLPTISPNSPSYTSSSGAVGSSYPTRHCALAASASFVVSLDSSRPRVTFPEAL
jgi:hypothetical protein